MKIYTITSNDVSIDQFIAMQSSIIHDLFPHKVIVFNHIEDINDLSEISDHDAVIAAYGDIGLYGKVHQMVDGKNSIIVPIFGTSTDSSEKDVIKVTHWEKILDLTVSTTVFKP